ncbi:ATP-binding cassette domain-containing protein [Microbacterium elymi]|uniref:ATP-binding cassette domain-containing protein n=1 Tax=Microbacterium elymi TaxID=2909587 RepID=A0ABY5NLG3_9MICO|nr:ATP-binding cassette domain-containing protein [Microbacterium elymi]UUT35978.1 ATP-binding cassette domain-containing protein [Microbacterium elymi]
MFDSSLTVGRGEAVGLVGESGSGKTLTVRAVAGILPEGFTTRGAIRIDGRDIDTMSGRDLRDLRARRIGMIFQTPRAHLNPLRTIGDFMTEALVHVAGATPKVATRRAIELLDEVGINDPGRRMRQHPAELSGGLLRAGDDRGHPGDGSGDPARGRDHDSARRHHPGGGDGGDRGAARASRSVAAVHHPRPGAGGSRV